MSNSANRFNNSHHRKIERDLANEHNHAILNTVCPRVDREVQSTRFIGTIEYIENDHRVFERLLIEIDRGECYE